MRVIKASEVGSYLYCRRAWWYHLNGMESINQAEMAAGTALHRQHGRKVLTAGLVRSLAWLVLLAALVALVSFALLHWFSGG